MINKRIKYLFTKEAITDSSGHFLEGLGILWLLVEVGSFFFDVVKEYRLNFFWIFIIFAALSAVKRSIPPMKFSKKSRASNVEIVIKVGNLFDEPGNIAFGCSECFDTEPEKVIGARSLIAQLLNNTFGGDYNLLNQTILDSLNSDGITGTIDSHKTFGKNVRYPIGTVAVVEPARERKIFLTAFSTTNNDRTSSMTKEDLWTSLCSLWKAVNRSGHKDPVAIPVLGAGLGGFQASRTSLIELLLLSFAIATREKIVTRKLTLIIRDEDYDPREMAEGIQMLKTLEF